MLEIEQNRFTCWPISTPTDNQNNQVSLDNSHEGGKDETRAKNQAQSESEIKAKFITWSKLRLFVDE